MINTQPAPVLLAHSLLALSVLALPVSALAATPTDSAPGKPLRLTGEELVEPLQLPAAPRMQGPVYGHEALPGGVRIHIVQFHESVPADFDDWEFDLRRDALGFLPEDALIVRATDAQAARIADHPEVRWVGPFQPQWRISPEIANERARLSMAEALPLDLELALWRGSRADRVMAELARLGATDIRQRRADAGNTRVMFRLGSDRLEELASLAEVSWIEPAPVLTRRALTASNATSSWVVQSNSSGVYPAWNAGLHGQGEIIGLIDSQVNMDSCFFFDSENGNVPGPDHRKVVAYFTPIDKHPHGTHTAGTLAGKRFDGSLANAGIAYEAKIAHELDFEIEGFLDTPSTLKAAFIQAQNVGAWIHSNSWGDNNRTSYTFWCVDIDEYLWENEDAVVVFAAANLSSLRSPENAKNSLAVVASNRPPFQESVYIGGAGPTSDGRRKPEIVAPGRSVVSANSSDIDPEICTTRSGTGTSMATPAVAASAALVRQYFREGYYPTGVPVAENGFIPSGPLIKAVLLNGTVDMLGHAGYPGNREGWGRLLLDRSLQFENDPRKLLVGERRQPQGLTTGQIVEVPFVVNSDAEQLAVTLTWYDPPAAHAASTAWINDLNLQVISPLGEVYLGNVFFGGFSIADGFADERNNVEQVRRQAPETGQWTLRIIGENIPLGPQGFAWAISGDVSPATTVPLPPFDTLWID